jgi:hypothetical protein
MKTSVMILVLAFLLSVGTALHAQVPRTLTYQGVLTDTAGTPVPNGTYSLTFRLYQTSTGGSPLWQETKNLSVERGVFSTTLGEITPLSLPFDRQYWLSIQIANNPELSPRIALTSSAYSLHTQRADTASYALTAPQQGFADSARIAGTIPNNSVNTAKLQDAAVTPTKLADNAVTTSKIQNLAVTLGKLDTSGASIGQVVTYAAGGVIWQTPPAGGLSLPYSGSAAANGPAFRVTNSNSGGVAVQGTNSLAGDYGILGKLNYGVYGVASSSNGNGVLGVANNGSNAYGVWGRSSAGYGVYGQNDNTGNYGYLGGSTYYGVYGFANSTNGTGVKGEANNGVFSYGVRGESNTGFGVKGENTASGNLGYLGSSDYGVYGASISGTGVRGGSSFGDGVVGSSSGGINTAGVHGIAAGPNSTAIWGQAVGGVNSMAGWFAGNVHVAGNLSKTTGSFKIDHPLDPANKYLYHSFVESPDMMNIYNGNVVLDANGEAWVELPAYFEALNKDFRYQLTPIGSPGPNLFIAQEISGNRFKIAGGSPGMKVSWQVTGIRHDPYAEAHRIHVEVEKTGKEKGKYIHPKEYGVSETLGIDYEAHQKIVAEEARMKAEQEKMQAEHERMKAEQERMQKEEKK